MLPGAGECAAAPAAAAHPPATPQELSLTAADGYRLAATSFAAQGQPRGRLLLAGATGVPQRFYRRFAHFAAARGYTTLTLDYRGIGQSKPASLRGFEMDYRDWARLDLAAAVDALQCPPFADGTPLVLVGHSYGGHAIGLLPQHAQLAGAYTFGSGAGWHGWMPRLEQVRVLAMWRVLGPLMTRRAGYLPWSRLGLGEDLPLGVYRQWRAWCRHPHYFFDDPEIGAAMRDLYAQVRLPMVAATALDDRWAPPASRDAFMRGYASAPWQPLDIDPRSPALRALGAIGHMGYFRPAAQVLWAQALDWFDGLAASAPPASATATSAAGRPVASPPSPPPEPHPHAHA